jgi:hypothetical protein
MEITSDAIFLTTLDGERNQLYKILPGPHEMKAPDEYVMHLQLLPHRDMDLDTQRRLVAGGGLISFLFKLDGNKIRPLIISGTAGAEELKPGEHSFELFNITRCRSFFRLGSPPPNAGRSRDPPREELGSRPDVATRRASAAVSHHCG